MLVLIIKKPFKLINTWLFVLIPLLSPITKAAPTPNLFLMSPEIALKTSYSDQMKPTDRKSRYGFHLPDGKNQKYTPYYDYFNRPCFHPPKNLTHLSVFPIIHPGNSGDKDSEGGAIGGGAADEIDSQATIDSSQSESHLRQICVIDHDVWRYNDGIDLLRQGSSRIEVKGIPFGNGEFQFFTTYSALPAFSTATLPSTATALPYEIIRVVSFETSVVDVGDDDIFSYSFFFVIKKTDNGNTAVGHMRSWDTDGSCDVGNPEGHVLFAPNWESLITHLETYQIRDLINNLNASEELKTYLLSMLTNDIEVCKKYLSQLLNGLNNNESAPSTEYFQ